MIALLVESRQFKESLQPKELLKLDFSTRPPYPVYQNDVLTTVLRNDVYCRIIRPN